MAEEMVEERQFTCPTCGSHKFGTTGNTGSCHGWVAAVMRTQPCTFIWPRSEDSKYFKGTGRFYPRVQTAQVVPRSGNK